MVVAEYKIENANGIRITVLDLGGIVMSLEVPDLCGELANVVLGYPNAQDYLTTGNPFYFGAIIGRCANRIAGGQFRIGERLVQVTANDNKNHLHGGLVGFDKVFWDVEPIRGQDWVGLKLRYVSKDGEEGFPGNLEVVATYRLGDDDTFTIEYEASTDKPTVVNLSHHSYFNLTGDADCTIDEHELLIHADQFTPLGSDMLPVGRIEDVADTPLDFRVRKQIGRVLETAISEQLRLADGFDHNLIVQSEPNELKPAAVLFEARSKRIVTVATTEPGLHFYSGNFLSGTQDAPKIRQRSGLCLEPQHFPNSPNESNFPSTILLPSDTYNWKTVYSFSTVKN